MALVIDDYIHHSGRKRKYRIVVATTLPTYTPLTDVESLPKSLSWSHEGSVRDPHKRIIPTKATIQFLINSSEMVTFIRDIAQNTEGTFLLFVYWVNKISTVETPVFFGHILPDPVEYQIKGNATVKIKATDGLALLKYKRLPKDIFLKNAAYNHAFYFLTILSSIPWVKYLLGTDDELFRTSINLYPTEFANSDGMINEVGVGNYFFSESEEGVIEFHTYYDILNQFLEKFNAHITFQKGVYCIYTLTDRIENNSITWSRFKYSTFIFASPRAFFADLFLGTVVDNVSVNNTSGSRYKFTAPPLVKFTSLVRKVVLTQTGDYYDNLLFDKKWYLGQPTPSFETLTEVGTQDYNKRVLIDFRIKAYVVVDDPSTIPNGTLTFTIRVGVSPSDFATDDGKWLRIVNPSGPNNYLNVGNSIEYTITKDSTQWQTGNVNDGIKLLMECENILQGAAITPNKRIIIESPLIDTSGFVYVDVTDISINDSGNPIIVALIMETDDERIVIGNSLTETSDESGSRTITKIIDDENTRVVSLNTNMGDFPNSNVNQRLLRRDAGEWKDTDEWTNGTTSDKIVNHLIENVALLRNTAKELLKLDMLINDDLIPPMHLDKLEFNGKTYMPIKSKFQNDRFEATYFEIGVPVPGSIPGDPITVGTSQTSDIIPGYIVPYTGNDPVTNDILDDGPNVPPLEELSDYYNIFENVTDDFIQLPNGILPDPALYQDISINQGIKLHVGSSKYRFKNSTTLPPTEFRIDKANEKIFFQKTLRKQDVEIECNKSKYKLI